MRSGHKGLPFRWVLLGAVFGLVSLSAIGAGFLAYGYHPAIKSTNVSVQGNTVHVPTKLTIAPNKPSSSYSSPSFTAAYTYNAIAPHWQETGASDTNRHVFIRSSQNKLAWTDWTEVEAMRQQKDGTSSAQVYPEAPIITLGKFFQYKVELTRTPGSAPTVSDMNVTYLDSRPTALQKVGDAVRNFFAPSANAASGTPHIISRTDWGSPDPSGNAFKGTDRYWVPQYHPVKQVFVHHTVDSNYQSQTNGAALVRAVWQYHTYTLGWGDIGYNYLVDQSGNIYQGRAHGDNIDAGHVYGYNSGSMGVALLGCFQPSDSTCKQLGNGSPSGAMTSSLTSLLAFKMSGYEINPTAQQNFCKGDGSECRNLYTISGHRDAYQTSCPGDIAYNQLASIRTDTAAKMAGGFSLSAKQLDYPQLSLGDQTQASVTLHYKNTGTSVWHNAASGQPNPIVLGTSNQTDHTSPFQGTGWISPARAANLNEPTVGPGETGSFTFNIANPAGYYGQYYEYFRPLAENLTDFGMFTGIPILTRTVAYSIAGQEAYTDSTKTTGLDGSNLSPGQTGWLVLKARNTGNTSWKNSGPGAMFLGTDAPQDKTSPMCTTGWIGCNRPAKLAEATVAPGAVGTFEWPVTTPAINGDYREYVSPLIDGVAWLNPTGLNYYFHVNGGYSWAPAGQYAYTDAAKTAGVDLTALSPGQRVYVGILAKNTGNAIWNANGPYPVHLGTSRSRDRASAFCDPSWLGCNRPAALKNAADAAKTTVAPGETADFGFWYVAPAPGTYAETFSPVVENITWMNDPGVNHFTRVKGDFRWAVTQQYAYTDAAKTAGANLQTLTAGQRVYVGLTVKNTGNTTWYRDGRFPVHLGTTGPRDRMSTFCDSSWLGCNRPAALTNVTIPGKAQVDPGETADFGFWYVAPARHGAYPEGFTPVAENLGWFQDLGVNHYSVVQ